MKATIYNWQILGQPGNYYIVGQVKGHPDAKDGEVIKTSRVKAISFTGGFCNTLNSEYRLESPADGTTPFNKDTAFYEVGEE
jgi:hypothetical protein